MTLDITKEEASALLQLIDMAVRANGMQVAEAGLHFVKKIQDAAKAEDAKPTIQHPVTDPSTDKGAE